MQVSQCSRFGNDLSQASPTSRSGVFANVSTPLTCTGNATGWNICYYNSTTDANTNTYFSVYRLYSGTQYYLVNGSLSNYTIARNSSRNYTCTQLPISRQYTVQPNDIIVVCVRNASSGRLGIAGNVTGTFSTPKQMLLPVHHCLQSLQLGSSFIRISATLHVNLAVNECAVGNGGCAHLCTDLTLGSNCSCYAGYRLDANGTSCSDINECSTNNGGCSQICNNTLGSNVCACNSGYYLAADNRTCNDTNECLTFNGNCSQNCNNTIGGYFCSCISGYDLTADTRTCTDTNECLTFNGNCSQNCNNTIGGYFCSCISGYNLTADTRTCTALIALVVQCHLRRSKKRTLKLNVNRAVIRESGIYTTVGAPLPLNNTYRPVVDTLVIPNPSIETDFYTIDTNIAYEAKSPTTPNEAHQAKCDFILTTPSEAYQAKTDFVSITPNEAHQAKSNIILTTPSEAETDFIQTTTNEAYKTVERIKIG
eukprot:Em0011g751a